MADVYNLTRDEAFSRSSVVSDVCYTLKIRLRLDDYEGGVHIGFNVSDPSVLLWIDYKGDEVSDLQINGSKAEVNLKTGKLALSGLKEGPNTVLVIFKNHYANDGCGLHKFVDPEDGEPYLYTQFEPFYAHRCFPCFDQPDLKAVLQLSVAAPEAWKVIANTLEVEAHEDPHLPISEGEKLTVFKSTARISTYLYAIVAGPYAEYRVNENEVGIPLGFYCRKALIPYFVVERYIDITVKGFKFYNEFFDFPYPFEKYDQIFVPEFNAGAMENVGCVTYRDAYAFRDPPSRNQLLYLAVVMLHEMAHMWFGNLVTMKWWDDLWLNESFADYICFYAIDKGLPGAFPEVWQSFLDSKGWGYDTDQLPTTHPISCIVHATDETETNFDGISYSKGAAVLKQLSYVVGEVKFREGLRKYMHKYQFSNSIFENLISILNDEVELDLHQWADSWIKTAGLNEILPIVQASEGGVVESFSIVQRAALPEHGTLRAHRLKVEFYDSDFNLELSRDIDVLPQENTVIDEVTGIKTPAFVLLNAGDHDYVKPVLTSSEVQILKDGLYKIESALSRQIIIRAVWDQVRDLKVSGAEFVELVVSTLPKENNLFNIVYLLLITSEALSDYVPSGLYKDDFSHSIFQALVDKMRAPSATPEVILQLQKYIFIYATHHQDIEAVVQWLEAKDTGIPGFNLSQGDRWKILKLYSSRNAEHSIALAAAEAAGDQSDTGKYNNLYCQAASPVAETKAVWWTRFVSEGQAMSRYERQFAMGGFNQKRQQELLLEYCSRYFEALTGVIASTTSEYSSDFVESLLPEYVDESTLIPLVKTALANVPEGHAKITRFYTEKIDLLTKQQVGKELSTSYLTRDQS